MRHRCNEIETPAFDLSTHAVERGDRLLIPAHPAGHPLHDSLFIAVRPARCPNCFAKLKQLESDELQPTAKFHCNHGHFPATVRIEIQ